MVVWHHKKSKTSRGVVNTAYRNEKLSLISRDKRLTPRKQSGQVLSRPSLTNRTQADTRLDRAELSIFTSVAYYSTSAILRRKKWDVLKNRRHRANALSRVLTLLSPTNRTQGDTRRDRCEKQFGCYRQRKEHIPPAACFYARIAGSIYRRRCYTRNPLIFSIGIISDKAYHRWWSRSVLCWDWW